MNKIYTLGYDNFLSSDFAKLVNKLDATIIDIRFANYSFSPFWTGNYLISNFGPKYKHVKYLGNKNYNNKNLKIEIFNIEKGLEEIKYLVEINNVILLSGCRDFDSCHRKVVSEEIKKNLNIETIEISEYVR